MKNKLQNKCTALPQIRAGQQSITANLQPLTTHIYHVMITVTGCFSKKSFLLILFLLPEILLNNLELVFLDFKHIYKTQRTNMFSFYLFIFYLLFRNHSVYLRYPPFRTFPLHVNTQDKSVIFLLVVLQALYVIMLSTFCTWTGSLTRTPKWTFYVIKLPYQFS